MQQNTMYKRAIILAGGKGVRLRPYTLTLPKPMMPLDDQPILEIIIRQLVSQGFTHLTLAVNHQAEVIQQYFQDGERFEVRIDYSLEQKSLGTLGPVLQIKDLPDQFLVMNADVLTDLSFREFWNSHQESDHGLTVGVCERKYQSDFGVVRLSEEGEMTGFLEKPIRKEWVSMGIYMVSRSVLRGLPANQRIGFDHLFSHLLDSGCPPSVFQHRGYWLDIGSPDDYKEACQSFTRSRQSFLPD